MNKRHSAVSEESPVWLKCMLEDPVLRFLNALRYLLMVVASLSNIGDDEIQKPELSLGIQSNSLILNIGMSTIYCAELVRGAALIGYEVRKQGCDLPIAWLAFFAYCLDIITTGITLFGFANGLMGEETSEVVLDIHNRLLTADCVVFSLYFAGLLRRNMKEEEGLLPIVYNTKCAIYFTLIALFNEMDAGDSMAWTGYIHLTIQIVYHVARCAHKDNPTAKEITKQNSIQVVNPMRRGGEVGNSNTGDIEKGVPYECKGNPQGL